MRVVPVMDVRGGLAVHADGGDRSAYRPLSERFGVPDDPAELAAWIEERWGRRLLYLADLDALAGGGRSLELVETLAAAGHRLRVDAGVRDAAGAAALRDAGAREVVVPLETLPSWQRVAGVAERVGSRRTVVSLDLRGGRPAGSPGVPERDPASLARAAASAGAGRLLALELERIGAARGPDLELLRRCRAGAPDVAVSAAGGVRHAGDVDAAGRAGCDECMVATALYGGRLPPSTVRRLEAGHARPG